MCPRLRTGVWELPLSAFLGVCDSLPLRERTVDECLGSTRRAHRLSCRRSDPAAVGSLVGGFPDPGDRQDHSRPRAAGALRALTLIRELRLHKPGSPEWLAIKRKLDASGAMTDADRIARETDSIAEGLGADETEALHAYFYDVMKRCPKD